MAKSGAECWQKFNYEHDQDRFDRVISLYAKRAQRHAKAAAALGYEYERLTNEIMAANGDGETDLAQRLQERATMVRRAHAREILETAQAGRVMARMASQDYVIDELTHATGLSKNELDVVQAVVGVAEWVSEL